jgi:hypothetical protein
MFLRASAHLESRTPRHRSSIVSESCLKVPTDQGKDMRNRSERACTSGVVQLREFSQKGDVRVMANQNPGQGGQQGGQGGQQGGQQGGGGQQKPGKQLGGQQGGGSQKPGQQQEPGKGGQQGGQQKP